MKRILLTLLLALFIPSGASAYTFLYTCGPTWTNLPITYYINQVGSDNMPFSTLENLIEDSYDAWEAPCCSRFRAQYGGPTQLTAVNNNQRIVLSWEESQWDPRFGSANVTIGVTLTSVWNDCTIAEAPILFNGVGFQFTTNGGGTDLQSIATHEIGHMLGLAHSSVFEATMYASYVGGSGARTLHQDDTDGVCALYNKPCTCVTSNDCAEGDICQNGLCRNVPCTSDANCQTGLECNTSNGRCEVPPCTSDAACGAGFVCKPDGECEANCTVCKECESNNDCGANAVCIQSGRCVVFCQQGGLCPGDSECYDVQGNYVCLNANADTAGICPDGYVCIEESECTSDSQCNAGDSCVLGKCEGPCADIECPSGQVCRDSRCYPDLPANNNNNNNPNNSNNTTGETNTGDTTTDPTDPTDPGNNVDEPNNNNGNSQTDDPVVVILEKQSKSDGCTSAAGQANLPLFLLALGFLLRRRRSLI